MKPVLITGANGFLGSYITEAYTQQNNVLKLGRSDDNDIIADLGTGTFDLPEVSTVIHNAGKAHVLPKNKSESEEFFQINVDGTRNLLASLQALGTLPERIVYISSVAVYGLDRGIGIKEDYLLGGDSPYALSKIQAEKLVREWGDRNQVPVVILRLPLVIGLRNPKGNLLAMLEGLNIGRYMRPGKGSAQKSMVMASDIADLLPNLEKQSGTFNLTDGHHPCLAELDSVIADCLGKKVKALPDTLLKVAAKIGDYLSGFPFDSYRYAKMTSTLTFDDNLARQALAWNPNGVLEGIRKEFGKL